ncbi:hypothetical protein K9B35_18150 [Sphingomonas sp. R647]|uniref:hypothetical protein n=1 Tax=Sphingomonas sp. R647 TaxID=2875233 RepID=UPI001CD2794E|nr:hypothetical protein [Sphingomonas sp. R647]MCA1199893.1 hypothetical protein [Sphingomonas sp. R647]
MTRALICATILMMFQTACSSANSRDFDSSDPVHCMVIFGIAANSARQMGQPAIADEMTKRVSFLAERHGGAGWIKQITPRSQEVGRKMEAANDQRATIKLFDDCVAAQDADPQFRARTGRK